jgi:hypothetical protein
MAPGILAQSVLFVAIFYDMLTGGVSAFGLGEDFTILLVAVAIMVIIGGKLYPRVAIRIKIIFWSVPVIELLEQLQIPQPRGLDRRFEPPPS